MKKEFLCIVGAVLACTVQARELKDFNELKSAIQEGNNINIVVKLGQCDPANSDPVAVTAALRPRAFMVVKNQILASDLHFTRNSPLYSAMSVLEYVTYRFSDDNQLVLESETLEAIHYYPMGKKHTLSCAIGTGVRLFSDAVVE